MHIAQLTQPDTRIRRLLGLLASFFLGQGALQGVSVLIGLFLVRSLSVRAYAQFGLALGFQATAATLMDLGFASTVVPWLASVSPTAHWLANTYEQQNRSEIVLF